MSRLILPADYPFADLVTELSPADTMLGGDPGHYLAVGLSALDAIEVALVGAPAPRRILDLPCGHGRVTRVLRARYPAAAITVSDIDPEGVTFCVRAFRATGVVCPPDLQGFDLGETFDLIWVGSLLTHLPEHLTRRFLDFAARHMGPQSRLVVTTHGGSVVRRLRADGYGLGADASRAIAADFLAHGYGYRGYDGSPSYGIALADRRWFESLLAGSPLRLATYQPQGWDRHQDVLVLRRASAAPTRFAAAAAGPAAAPQPADAADTDGFAGFDEAWYRRTYADVDRAVAEGVYRDGLHHFVAYGWAEGRAPFDAEQGYGRRTPPREDAWIDGTHASRQVEEAWFAPPEEQAAAQGDYWMAHPSVRARANRLASGDPDVDAYAHLARLLQARGWTLPIARAASIGCGFGGLERDLAQRGLVAAIDGYDLAPGAIVRARREAARLGLQAIRYHVADLETFALPEASVDVAFAHSSVHHVARLEALYAMLQRAIRPGGIFHLHEFVGPSRFQWTQAQLDLANGFLDRLPPRLRRQPDGEAKPPLTRPTVAAMLAADPSESVRSAELLALLEPCFEIVEHRKLGGALAHLALGGIAQNFDPASPGDEAWLAELFALEDDAMRRGVIDSDFAVVVATPKPVARRAAPSRSQRPMQVSLAARAAALVPPVRRLLDSVATLRAEQARTTAQLSASVASLRERQDRLEAALDALRPTEPASPQAAPVAAAPAAGATDAALDRATRREMGEAARRHLPFLPGVFRVAEDCITVEGYCGAPEGLTERMAFFVNGERIDDVDYPIEDPELKSRFPDVPGMGLVFRARVRNRLDALRAARFWRFDASPTGRFIEADWRRAIHYMNPAMERFPFPPEANIRRVIGDTSIERFAMGGATIFNNAGRYLRELGHDWTDFPNILDWGCGAGRLTRYLVGETSAAVTGVDIDPDNIGWCQRTYTGGSFATVPLRPRTGLDAARFDLVFGLSVMTHLQERDQFLWLEELWRIARTGALLFLSIQGPTWFSYNRFPPSVYRRIQQAGFVDLKRDDALAEVIADREYYRSAMHSRRYIVERWGQFFEVVAIVDAIAALQDFVVLRKR